MRLGDVVVPLMMMMMIETDVFLKLSASREWDRAIDEKLTSWLKNLRY